MFHPGIELSFLDSKIGHGLVATQPIPRGTITWVLCELEQVFDPKTYRAFPKAYRAYLNKYTYETSSGDRVLCCDLGRYINHSCEPNTLTLPDLELEVAIRDIAVGEQITDDYGTMYLDDPLHCSCGSPSCRGVIRRADVERFAEHWKHEVASALSFADQVEQPLLPFLADSMHESLALLQNSESAAPSR